MSSVLDLHPHQETSLLDWVPLDEDAFVPPHNGRDGYRVDLGKVFPERADCRGLILGGQQLMLWGMINFKVFVNSCGRRVGKTSTIPYAILEKGGRHKGNYVAAIVSPNHDKAVDLQRFFLEFYGGDPKEHKGSLVSKVKLAKGQDRWIKVHPHSIVDEDGTVHAENTGIHILFLSGTHPYYLEIQGLPYPIDDFFIDEMQLQNPELITRVAMPMLQDSGGDMVIIGTSEHYLAH